MVNSNSNILLVIDFVIALCNTISGNLTVTLSDHHLKLLMALDTFNTFTPMSNKYERDWLRLD